MNRSEVVQAIMNGELDDDFDSIHDAIRSRRQSVNVIKRSSMNVGDEVEIHDCRPKYLNGKRGIVTDFTPTKIVVDLHAPAGRFHKNIVCEAAMLKVV